MCRHRLAPEWLKDRAVCIGWWTTPNGDISGSHGGEYEDDCLLACCVV
jgi:hypothetical protein